MQVREIVFRLLSVPPIAIACDDGTWYWHGVGGRLYRQRGEFYVYQEESKHRLQNTSYTAIIDPACFVRKVQNHWHVCMYLQYHQGTQVAVDRNSERVL